MTKIFSKFRAILLCSGLLLSGLSPAAALDDAQTLIAKNDLNAALTRINQHLSEHPKDRDGRFLKGILLTEMRRFPEAIEVFTALTRDEPTLPEPYNNLAVIYASQGQFDRAREALELAIKTHPSYSVAHENLGDLYAKLASMAYDKALELDRANTATQGKLALIRELFSAPTRAVAATITAATLPTATITAAPQPTLPASSKTAAATKATKKAAEPPTTMLPAPFNIETTLHAWAAAWSRQDVTAYLDHYSANFQPQNGQALEQWKTDRRTRIEAPKSILIELQKIVTQIDAAGDQQVATATFKQHYKSERLNEWTRKTLRLTHDGKDWRIIDER
jgi:tetratricopeptide (TPR) repeat protein